ncbi:hypothetical protein HC776_01570 [bacterium]|nr:hypothetical protein [bacterium]
MQLSSLFAALLSLLALAACQTTPLVPTVPPLDSAALVQAITPIPTLMLRPTLASTAHSAHVIQISSALATPTLTPVAATDTPAFTPTLWRHYRGCAAHPRPNGCRHAAACGSLCAVAAFPAQRNAR